MEWRLGWGGVEIRLDNVDIELKKLGAHTYNNSVTLAVLVHEVQTVENDLKRMLTRDDLAMFIGQIDGFSAEVQASRHLRVLQDKSFWDIKERLDDHEMRLTRVEGKS